MTKNEVIENAPSVNVLDRNGIHEARISGLRLEFPVLHRGDNNRAEVCWDTLLHCINDNVPVNCKP